MSNTNIAHSAALIKVTPTSVYSPSAKLEEMAADYAARNNIDRRQLRGTKKLLPEEIFSPLREIMKEIVSYLDTNTSLWEDGGWRICRANKVFDIETQVSQYAWQYHAERDRIMSRWASVEWDMKVRLGAAFDPSRFPSAEKVREHLTIVSNWKPVPTAGDWRIDLPQSIVNKTEEDTKALLVSQQERVRSRVISALRALQDKCSSFEEGKSRIHQSTLDEVANLATVIPGLLIMEDPSLTAICEEASRSIRGVDRDILRDSAPAREAVTNDVADLLAKLGFNA